jgi:N-acetylglucosamine-6-phosphate deacetylase
MTIQQSEIHGPETMVSFVDLQINGLAGVDFNSSDLETEEWQKACRELYRDGTGRFLPTLITDSFEALQRKLARLGQLLEANPEPGQAIAVGIHLEGPFLSPQPGYVGAHPSHHARDADLELMKRWFDSSQQRIRMVTLAPERDPKGSCTRWLADQGVLVAAGHTDATLDQLRRAIDHGLSIFTHLGNACPMDMHRHDNIIHRALSLRSSLRYTMIGDGYHLPSWLLADWIQILGIERVALVSDAISAAGLPAGLHRLGERFVSVASDGVPRSQDGSHFVGSGMTLGLMNQELSKRNLFSSEIRRRLLCDNAADWLGIRSTEAG